MANLTIKDAAGVSKYLDGNAAGDNTDPFVIGHMMRMDDTVIEVTFSLDTSAYASGDLLADTQAIASAARKVGGQVELRDIVLIDEDDQGMALSIVLLDTNNSLGTENNAPSISDANARKIIGFVPVATTDYIDLGGVKIATIRNIGLLMQADAAATSLYVALVNGSGAPTYTASGLRGKFSFRRS